MTKQKRVLDSFHHTFPASELGDITVVGANNGVRAVLFENQIEKADSELLGSHISSDDHPVIEQAVQQLHEYFAGSRTEFNLPLFIDQGLPVYRKYGDKNVLKVLRAVNSIPYGQTKTYGGITKDVVGETPVHLKLTMIGHIISSTQLNVIIPTHRVLGAGNSLVGYPGGVARKRLLLNLEESNRPSGS